MTLEPVLVILRDYGYNEKFVNFCITKNGVHAKNINLLSKLCKIKLLLQLARIYAKSVMKKRICNKQPTQSPETLNKFMFSGHCSKRDLLFQMIRLYLMCSNKHTTRNPKKLHFWCWINCKELLIFVFHSV